MTARCEPPEALRQTDGWHWLTTWDGHKRCVYWCFDREGWLEPMTGKYNSGFLMDSWGWDYLCPIPSPAELAALRAENKRLTEELATAQTDAFDERQDLHAEIKKLRTALESIQSHSDPSWSDRSGDAA